MWHSPAIVQSGVEHGQHRGVGSGDLEKSDFISPFFSGPHVTGLDQRVADGATSLSCRAELFPSSRSTATRSHLFRLIQFVAPVSPQGAMTVCPTFQSSHWAVWRARVVDANNLSHQTEKCKVDSLEAVNIMSDRSCRVRSFGRRHDRSA